MFTPSPVFSTRLCLTVMILVLIGSGLFANDSEVPGFTEAIKKVDVAAKESGLLNKLNVKQGDIVEKGMVLGQLDNEIQMSQLAIASHLAKSNGDIDRAESELKTKKYILEHFEKLSADGFAQEKELLRARMEVEIAQANLLARREKQTEYVKRMELAQLQLKRRDIPSPISGQVMELHRSVGEFVSITQPQVLTVVQTSPVRGKFLIRLNDLGHFQVGNKAVVKIAGRTYIGKVESIGLVATSETVPVCVEINNDDQSVKLGQKCSLVVPKNQLTSVGK